MSRKIIGVTVGTTLPKPNFKQTDPTKGDYIRNKPDFDGLKDRVDTVSGLVGDKAVSEQITSAIEEIPKATWEGLPDKPFGEVDGINDALEWDGDTSELYNFRYETGWGSQGNHYDVYSLYYKVSDAIFTIDDLANGGTITFTDVHGTHTYQIVVGNSASGDQTLAGESDGIIHINAPDSVNGFPMHGIYCYPEGKEHPAGIYFAKSDCENWTVTVNKLVINEYKFPGIKKLDKKYLPFGEEIPKSGTLRWDGNTDGLYVMDSNWYKVSDNIITMDDLSLGVMFEYNAESSYLVYLTQMCSIDYPDMVYQKDDGTIALIGVDEYGNSWEMVICIPDNHIHPAGIYFAKNVGIGDIDNYMRVFSLTIFGYDKFTITDAIDTKYLPKHLRFGEIPGGSDILKWHGDINDSDDMIYGNFYKISDIIVTSEDLANGVYCNTITNDGLQGFLCTFEDGYITTEDDGSIVITGIDTNGNEFYSVYCCPEGSNHTPGIYFLNWDYFDESYGEYYIHHVDSIEIPGFGKFPTVKTISKDYLPESLRFGPGNPIDITSLPESLQFGQEIIKRCLIWDGDLANCYNHSINNTFFRVSINQYDQAFTKGVLITYIDNGKRITRRSTFENGGIIQENGRLRILAEDLNGNTFDGVYSYSSNFSDSNVRILSGIYFARFDSDSYVEKIELLATGYYFTTPKVIDYDYLPESLQFGEMPGSDDLYGGAYSITTSYGRVDYGDGVHFRFSPLVPTVEELNLAENISIMYNDTGTYPYSKKTYIFNSDTDVKENGEIRFGDDDYVIIVYDKPNVQNGIYFKTVVKNNSSYSTVYSLTIPSYGKFKGTGSSYFKTIDKKYLPEIVPHVTSADNGKFLRVVDGVWAAVSLPNAEEANF